MLLALRLIATHVDDDRNVVAPLRSSGVCDAVDVMINIVIGAGIGGLSTGAITRMDSKYMITALAVEAEPAIAKTHQFEPPAHPHCGDANSKHQVNFSADGSLRAEAFLEVWEGRMLLLVRRSRRRGRIAILSTFIPSLLARQNMMLT